MPNPVISVPVTFNYNNGSPTWTLQDKITVPHGQIDTIQWNLSCTNLPANATGRFASTNPIQFVTRKNGVNGDTWTGQGPQRVSDTQVTVDDDNRGPVGQTKDYYYSVNVEVVNGTTTTPYTDDPQVENPGT